MKRTPGQRGSVLTWLLIVIGVLALLLGAAAWYARENPLALYERSTRRALAGQGMELRTLDTEVGRIAYWEGGSGPTLVLLHGAGDQAGAFQGVVAGLLPRYRVLIPDIPGHGDSQPAEGPLPMTVMYGGIREFLERLAGDSPPVLVGSSMGAWIAILQAHRYPETVARVIAINGGPLVGNRPDLSLTPADREGARKLMEAIRDPSFGPTPDFVLDDIVEQSARGPIGRMSAEVQDLAAHLLEGRLGEVSVPVDLLWGESDQLLSLDYAGRMLDQLPRARLTTIPACGHHPANECPDKLSQALDEVLAMAPPAAPQPTPPSQLEEND